MSGNPMLDAQIARAVQPQFDAAQAVQQMQRQPVQNPVFGGNIPMQPMIPMDFGLPAASQVPTDFQPRQFTPGLSTFNPYQASPNMGDVLASLAMGGLFGDSGSTAPVGAVQQN